MARGPQRDTVRWHVPATISADATDIPVYWNNTGVDWVLDETNKPTMTMVQSYTGDGSTSDGLTFHTLKLNRVSAAAAETGLCSHVLTTGTSYTAKVGEEFDNMTGSSYVIPDGTGINFDIDMGAGVVNHTVSAYSMLTLHLLRGEGATQS